MATICYPPRHRADDSSCSACGDLTHVQLDTSKARNANLTIDVTGAAGKPTLTLSPMIERQDLSDRAGLTGNRWSATYMLPPGKWQLEYLSGGKKCAINSDAILPAVCSNGYELRNSTCVLAEKDTCGQVKIKQSDHF